jgi:riboflavin kinase / FMN adenylyltransferase
VKVARSPRELVPRDRAVAIGSFDGVHLGHRRVLETLLETGPTPTVVTFDPHPRLALGYGVDLLSTIERRLELLAELGVAETVVVEFTLDVARLEPEEFAREFLEAIGTRVIVANDGFRFGRGRRGDLDLLRGLGFEVRETPLVEGVSSTEIRRLIREGDVEGAARLLGRPVEVEGTVVAGDARGGTLGFPTANLRPEPGVLVPRYGIYAGAAEGHRAAISIGTNPHYGGDERRIEAFLLDFAGDLYGKRLTLELWQRLREEQAFGSEAELVAQIDRDVEATRQAERPG